MRARRLPYALILSFIAAEAHGEAVNSLRLILPPQPDPVVENIGRVFARQVQSRCSARVVVQGEAPRPVESPAEPPVEFTVELAIEPGIGAEGFKIEGGAGGAVRISGNDDRGLLYGVGKFLHTSSYGSQGFTPGSWRGVSVPEKPLRGIYFATHFHNYYQVAPIDEVTRYVEDLSLWGINSFLVWFGMEEFHGIDDPKAQAMLERLRALLKIVKDLGLNACLGCICNDGYANSPASLRADDSTVGHAGYHTRMGDRIFNLGNELCPSKPGVPELELGFCKEKFDVFKSVGLDCWFIWPYDNGGCTCPKCAPWGTNGFLRMAEPLARAYRRAFPKGKVILGTWYFDRWADGEWAGLAEKFNQQKPDWVDYIMADDFGEYPRYPLEKGVPGGFPLLNFPEISMWGQDPWGGYGANPQPGRLQKRWDETGKKLSGGFPYSEGIYEDLNKVICAQLYWAPDRPAMETVKEYVAFEFSPEVVDDVTSAVKILEQNHLRDKIRESAVTACQLVERADAKLTPQARGSWRWRLFRIRASIDQEMYRNSRGQGRDKVFRQAYEELTRISHAKDAWPMLRPAPIPAVNVQGPDLPDPDFLKAKPEVVESWKDMRFGMFICWGPVTLTGLEIGWSRGAPAWGVRHGVAGGKGPTAAGAYDDLYKKWKPEQFSAREWVKVAQETGARYLVFLIKHHDGFCLFDTKLTDYKSTGAASAWKVDVMKEIAGACHEAGMKLIVYYSQPDWHHPDFCGEHHERYIAYLHGQIRELLTGYGRIDGLWFDGLGATAKAWDAENLFKLARGLQPWLIINNRCGLPGDFDTPEQYVGRSQFHRPWESCITLGTQWSWKPDDTLKPPADAIRMLVACAVGDGNLALNTNPMPDGRIEPRQVESFRKIGEWLKKYGESVYGTRGGPFVAPGMGRREFNQDFAMPGGGWWGGSTRKGDAIYLHILRWPPDTITLPAIPRKIVKTSVLSGGEATVKQTDAGIEVGMPAAQRDACDTIVKLELDGPAAGIEVQMPLPISRGKPARASSTWKSQPGFGAAAAFDGDPSTRWGAEENSRSGWLEVDLGKPTRVGRAVIDEGHWNRVRRFELQVEQEGAWKTIASGTTLGPEKEISFAPITACRFRLNILEAADVPTIWELELYEAK
jgi:alpha-L-fucosidase